MDDLLEFLLICTIGIALVCLVTLLVAITGDVVGLWAMA